MARRDWSRFVAAKLRIEAALEADLAQRSRSWLVQELRVRAGLLRETNDRVLAITGPASEEPEWSQRLARHYRRTAAVIEPFSREAAKSSKSLATDLVLEWIRQVALKKSALIVNGTREIVREMLEAMTDEGLGAEEMARRIETVAPELARHRSHAIARTETHAAASFASLAVAREMEAESAFKWEKQWLAVQDDRTRESHAALDGTVIGINDTWAIGVAFPGDPEGDPEQSINCFLPGTFVEGEFIAGSKAGYSGPAWEIETGRGHRLRVTPNHPILTTEGWVPAYKLREGDYLLSGSVDIENRPLRDEDHQNGPPRIEDVFDSIAANGAMRSAVAGALDFHGDALGIKSDIEIVVSERVLRHGSESCALERGADFLFVSTRSQVASVEGLGVTDSFVERFLSATSSIPSLAALALDENAVPFQLRPFDEFRLGPPPSGDSNICETNVDRTPGKPEIIGDGLHAIALEVAANDGLGERIPRGTSPESGSIGLTSSAEAALLHPFVDRRGNYCISERELRKALAVRVEPDRVVNVRRFEFTGHVYDLQTVSGVLIADGIVCSNCRCVEVYGLEGTL